MSFKISLVIDIVIVLASFTVFVIVLCFRRRSEAFIVSIPFLFICYGTLSILEFTYLLGWDKGRIPLLETEFGSTVIGSLTNYCLAMVYWVFAFQYLRTSLILPKLLIDQQVNDLIDKDITNGPSYLNFDFQGYKQIISDQKNAVSLIKRRVFLLGALVLIINIGMAIWGFWSTSMKNWGMLASFICAIAVLFYALGLIARTIKSV